VFRLNNSAIDPRVLTERIRTELDVLGRLRATSLGSSSVAGGGESAVPSARADCVAAGNSRFSFTMHLAHFIKRIPIIGQLTIWASWIIRAHTSARTALQAQADVREVRAQMDETRTGVAGMHAQVDVLESGWRRDMAALRTVSEAQSQDMLSLRQEVSAIRREIMFQQHRLSRMIEPVSRETAAPGAPAQIVHNQRLDSLYMAFEDAFRGSRDEIKQRLAPYIERIKLAGAGRPETPIVDVGCGRGEWLELLRVNGLVAYGIDTNSMMVERTASLGLDVRVADVLEHLRSLADCTRSAVTAFHVVEHLAFPTLVDFLDEAMRVIVPGGIMILETPNPENLRVGATTFYYDPTHRNPIPPDPLRFIVEHRGFSNVEIIRLHPSPEREWLQGEGPDLIRLNHLLFGPRDYAICARRI
jgi:2-polyprenyl-3-methyl-5-hydroxy-6-metoxy-1,4-benzoquinol methylase